MALHLDIDLTDDQKATMAALPATAWFSPIVWRNAVSPVHPVAALAENNELKLTLVHDWIQRAVPGKRVLDLFSGNGMFSVIAAQAGAREVVGVEFAEDRVRCAEFVVSTLQSDCRFVFTHGDVYQIGEYFDEPFDVVLCLGGLYHIADPAYILRAIGRLTRERLIMQTSQVLPWPGNWAKFRLRQRDRTPGDTRRAVSGHSWATGDSAWSRNGDQPGGCGGGFPGTSRTARRSARQLQQAAEQRPATGEHRAEYSIVRVEQGAESGICPHLRRAPDRLPRHPHEPPVAVHQRQCVAHPTMTGHEAKPRLDPGGGPHDPAARLSEMQRQPAAVIAARHRRQDAGRRGRGWRRIRYLTPEPGQAVLLLLDAVPGELPR